MFGFVYLGSRWKALAFAFVVFTLAGMSLKAMGQGHNYINMMRSSLEPYIMVTNGVEGEAGGYKAVLDPSYVEPYTNKPSSDYGKRTLFQGYGLIQGVGLEVMKFIQLDVNHIFVNLSSKNDARESLRGSRISAESRFVFNSPIGNIESGIGIFGTRLDYQRGFDDASFYGNGYYYTFGHNYFLSQKVSVYLKGRVMDGALLRSSGSSPVKSFHMNEITTLGMGIKIWLQ